MADNQMKEISKPVAIALGIAFTITAVGLVFASAALFTGNVTFKTGSNG